MKGRDGNGPWVELLPPTRLQPDCRHRFPVTVDAPVTEVRMDIYPDGGMLRLRLWGTLTDKGRAEAVEKLRQGKTPVLLVPAPLRQVLARFVRHTSRAAKVLSYQEIPGNRQVTIEATVG